MICHDVSCLLLESRFAFFKFFCHCSQFFFSIQPLQQWHLQVGLISENGTLKWNGNGTTDSFWRVSWRNEEECEPYSFLNSKMGSERTKQNTSRDEYTWKNVETCINIKTFMSSHDMYMIFKYMYMIILI